MKLYMSVMAPELISVVQFVSPSHHPTHLYLWRHIIATQKLHKISLVTARLQIIKNVITPMTIHITIVEPLASSSGLENRLTAVGDPLRWPYDTPPSTKVGTKFHWQVAVGIVCLQTKGHWICIFCWPHHFLCGPCHFKWLGFPRAYHRHGSFRLTAVTERFTSL
jgi:hypothetical protein